MKPRRPLTVTPHTPLQKLEENLGAVGSLVPSLPMMRRMTTVKLCHAVPLDGARHALQHIAAAL